MTLTSSGDAQGYTVRRHDDAILRGAVGAEDDGARVVHNSTATKNTSLQSVRDMIVIAMPWNAPLKRSALNIEAGQVSNLPSLIISAMMRITRSGGLSVLILLPLHILLEQLLEAFARECMILAKTCEVTVQYISLVLDTIAQFVQLPLPSVESVHPKREPRLEEHCRLVCRWQIKLHEQGVVADTHQAKTLLGRELADGIALDGVVSEIEFCYHIVIAVII